MVRSAYSLFITHYSLLITHYSFLLPHHSLIKKLRLIRIPYPIQFPHFIQDRFSQFVNIRSFQGGDEEGIAIGFALPAGAEVGEDLLLGGFVQPFVKSILDVEVYLVEDGDNGLVEGLELLQGLVHHTQLLFVIGMRNE